MRIRVVAQATSCERKYASKGATNDGLIARDACGSDHLVDHLVDDTAPVCIFIRAIVGRDSRVCMISVARL